MTTMEHTHTLTQPHTHTTETDVYIYKKNSEFLLVQFLIHFSCAHTQLIDSDESIPRYSHNGAIDGATMQVTSTETDLHTYATQLHKNILHWSVVCPSSSLCVCVCVCGGGGEACAPSPISGCS